MVDWNTKRINEVMDSGFLPSELGRSYFADKVEVRECRKCGDLADIPEGEDYCDTCYRMIGQGWEF